MQDLRKHLPRGYAKELAEKHNCSPDAVYKVAGGIRNNTMIRLSLAKLAARESECRRKIRETESKIY